MKAVSFASDGDLEPIESDLQTLRSRLKHFNARVTKLDAEMEAAQSKAAASLIDEDSEAVTDATTDLQSLRMEKETLVEAAYLAQQKLDERQVQLKAIHTHAEQIEANKRWGKVEPAAKRLDAALKSLDDASREFEAALSNVRKLSPSVMRPSSLKLWLRRWLFSRGSEFTDLVGEIHGGIPRAAGDRRPTDNTPLADLFNNDPAKRPYPNIED